ncbi:MAG: hypothetical protein EOO12_01925 [Chitinophagaceae bacterium]|nr:MAG: hypothetical protein EOO12_01925 [Chitinophagaceae bacterium]
MTAPRRNPLRQPAFFLLLLPVFFVGHGILDHYPSVRAGDVLGLLPVYWLAAVILTVLAWLPLRRWTHAALFAFAVLCVHFFFGGFHDFLKSLWGDRLPARYTFVLPLLALLLGGCLLFLKRTRATLRNVVLYLNVLLLLLLVVDGVRWSRRSELESQAPTPAQLAGLTGCSTCTKPDIYLIIADGYAGAGELSTYLNFDNRAFLAALRQRGFYVADSSRSNYNYTPFSMASMLNLQYLEGVGARYTLGAEKSICYPLIGENRFSRYLRDTQGYTLRNLSIFPVTGQRPPVYSPFFRNGREILTAQTFLSRFNRDVRFNLVTRFGWRSELKRYARYVVRDANDELLARTLAESRVSNDAPRFIYTHLEMPHDPYFYRKDGKENPVEVLADYSNPRPELYVEYLQWCNGRLLELVDGLRRNSTRPPVILLMSDHGFRTGTTSIPPDAQLLNLNAVLLPAGDYSRWYPGISNVNHLRVFLNTQFGQHLPLLRDSASYLVE